MTKQFNAKALVGFKVFAPLAQAKRSTLNEWTGEIGGQKPKGLRTGVETTTILLMPLAPNPMSELGARGIRRMVVVSTPVLNHSPDAPSPQLGIWVGG